MTFRWSMWTCTIDGFATLGTIGFEGRFDYAAIGTVFFGDGQRAKDAGVGEVVSRISRAVMTAWSAGFSMAPDH